MRYGEKTFSVGGHSAAYAANFAAAFGKKRKSAKKKKKSPPSTNA
jgi:hypothetical protein